MSIDAAFSAHPVLFIGAGIAVVCITAAWPDIHLSRWFASLRNAIADFILPFATIAAELRKMNQLKELELAERLNPKTGDPDPVILRTEAPGRHDTEITYGSGNDEPVHGKDKRNRELAAAWERENVDDEDD